MSRELLVKSLLICLPEGQVFDPLLTCEASFFDDLETARDTSLLERRLFLIT